MDYTLIRHIARGGFGRVDLVRDVFGYEFAKKTFDPGMLLDPKDRETMRKRFVREARAQEQLAKLHADQFVPIVDHELTGDTPFYLMPLADHSLQDAITVGGSIGLEPRDALPDLLDAVDRLHQLGYVHRDLKPSNVLLHNGRWKLCDLGLVRLPDTSMTTTLTTHGAWGSEMYCAPEQRSDFAGVGNTADIYAIGCVLHDIYARGSRIPYARHTATGPVGAVIEKCTETRSDRRFQSVAQLKSALFTVLQAASGPPVSSIATEWASAVKGHQEWTPDNARELLRYLTHADDGDRRAVLVNLDEESIVKLQDADADLWRHLISAYCEWIENSVFNFDFCDVLGSRLQFIASLGDVEAAARSALAAAVLAAEHNRWAVMEKVLKICGMKMDASIAQRVVIEIKAAGAEGRFLRCATVIDKKIDDYHPLIAAAIHERLPS